MPTYLIVVNSLTKSVKLLSFALLYINQGRGGNLDSSRTVDVYLKCPAFVFNPLRKELDTVSQEVASEKDSWVTEVKNANDCRQTHTRTGVLTSALLVPRLSGGYFGAGSLQCFLNFSASLPRAYQVVFKQNHNIYAGQGKDETAGSRHRHKIIEEGARLLVKSSNPG